MWWYADLQTAAGNPADTRQTPFASFEAEGVLIALDATETDPSARPDGGDRRALRRELRGDAADDGASD